MSISRPSPAWELPNAVSEAVVTYDSEFDIADAASLIKELEKQPWWASRTPLAALRVR
jgi:hypothetical protein